MSLSGIGTFGVGGRGRRRAAVELSSEGALTLGGRLSVVGLLDTSLRAAGEGHLTLSGQHPGGAAGEGHLTLGAGQILATVSIEGDGVVTSHDVAPMAQILRYVQGLSPVGRMAFWVTVQQGVVQALDDGLRGELYAFLICLPLLAWVLHAPGRDGE